MRLGFLLPGLQRLEKVFWALLLVTLPLTSFRYLPFFGSAQVKPLSLLPALVLVPLVLLRSLRTRKFLFWNSALPVLLAFSLAILLSSAWGGFLAPHLYDYTYMERVLRALITFAVGMVFLLLPVALVRSEEDLRFTMKWLFIGFLGHILWSLLQLVEIYILKQFFPGMPLGNLVESVQRLFSMAGMTSHQRISGLALEPSWLAAQVVTLYAPWLVAAMLKRYVLFKRRWLAPALLTIMGAMVILTYSRTGIAILFISASLTVLLTGWELFPRLWHWLIDPFRRGSGSTPHQPALRLSRLGLLLLFCLVLLAGGSLLARNEYFSALWQARETSLVDYFVTIYAGPRLAYAWAGWEIFTSHPWLGVGLGASGFYIHAALPDWAHFNLSEISMLLSPQNTTYPNVKNLYLRLLAELGIVGFWIWVAFNLSMLATVISLWRSPRRDLCFAGTAGLFFWISILLVHLSLDSLAMPLIWIPFGILLGLQEGSRDLSTSYQSAGDFPPAPK